MSDYLTASEAIAVLKIPPSTFYRFVREGKIKKYFPTAASKHGFYNSKEIARLSSKFRRESTTKDIGETDWIQSATDMGNMYNLEYPIYGDETGDPSIVRKWYERNPYICRILYNKDDRRDFWGAIVLLPLAEDTIFKILCKKVKDVELDPQKDILTFEQPGTYDFYAASVIMRPDKRHHFFLLINSVFDFWCEMAPERTIGKIYGRIVSVDGEFIAKKLFFSPIWHIAENAYMLDLARPNPSKIVQSFQYCVQSKRDEQE